MRLAILADIHGNLHALEAVLADAERMGAERLVVNGDLVNRGPNNVPVLEPLREVEAEVTLGNHDDLVRLWAERSDRLPASWFGDPFWGATAWVAEGLERSGWLGWLGELPMTFELDLPGAPRVLVAHGSPRHYREGLSPRLPNETLSEILHVHPAEVLVGSHTHSPMERSWGRHLVLNTGAVGAPFNGDPRAQYLLLTLEAGAWLPEFRRVAYDVEGALRAFEESGLLAAGGLSAHIFREELAAARSLLTPFWMWTEERGLAQTWATWRRFRAARG